MLPKPGLSTYSSNSSSNTSPNTNYDFDIGFGEIIEYQEDTDNPAQVEFGSFSTSLQAFEDLSYVSTGDRKGKQPHNAQHLDRYHPERSKSEIINYVESHPSTSGQIPTQNLRHSSDQWSNYYDLCESVKAQLRRDGYHNAKVECVQLGNERHILYQLH